MLVVHFRYSSSGLLTLVLCPLSITARCLVVDAGQEVEVLEWHLLRLDTELVFQLAAGSVLHTRHGLGQLRATLSWDTQWMGAAGVGPHIWESYLLGSTLLEEKSVLGVEKEDRECAVEETFVDVGHQMAFTG